MRFDIHDRDGRGHANWRAAASERGAWNRVRVRRTRHADQAVELGDTALGHRQYIPITGGTVAGPRLKGTVLPGGWDFQLTYAASNCTQLSADYFLKADDGTVIHVFNEGLACPGAARAIFRPRLEAPKGAYGWMTQATFVATLELEGTPPKVEAVRIRFYQVK